MKPLRRLWAWLVCYHTHDPADDADDNFDKTSLDDGMARQTAFFSTTATERRNRNQAIAIDANNKNTMLH
jgi:hypothetical protein